MIIKITRHNLNTYYYNVAGNLYYLLPNTDEFQILDGYTRHDCLIAMSAGVEFLYIEGPAIC